MTLLKTALIQMNSGDDKEKNLTAALAAIEQAAGQGAQLAVMPEYSNFLGAQEGMPANAEQIPGPTTERMAEAARRLGIGIMCGSIPEKSNVPDKVRNTAVFISEEGRILARYSKIHMFDLDVEGGVTYKESEAIDPGRELSVFTWRGITFGLAVCHDLRFPELFRRMMQQGAQIILVPAAFTRATGEVHWDALTRARAIENQVFICAVNQWGEHPHYYPTHGHSQVIDPWGKVIACYEDGVGPIMAEIDLDDLRRIRRETPILENIQPWLLKGLASS